MLRNRLLIAGAIGIVLAALVVFLGLPSALVAPGLSPGPLSPGPSRSAPLDALGPGADGVPASVGGLPVLSIRDALALRDADSSQRIAVFGWAVRFFVPCAQQPDAYQPLEDCVYGFTWLMAAPEELQVTNPDGSGSIRAPSGPAFNTTYGPPDPASPQAVVVIGRFHDPRSSFCPAGGRRDACGRLFVAESAAWLGPTASEAPGVAPGGSPLASAAGS
ncbi:MAG TPA: hypothetical protein VET90_05150 [Candidatus Binatus sp.]|nr:hypothetical protein [Candidatus Binatus sp.]